MKIGEVNKRGTRAEQPAATAEARCPEGTLYCVTDEGDILERSNGATWEPYSPAAGGDVSAAAALADNTLLRGDGGAKGIQDTGITVDDSDNMAGLASQAIGGAAADNAKQTVHGTYVSVPVANGNSGAAKTIDWAAGNEQTLTLTDNCTLTFSNPTPGGRYVLRVSSGAGSFTLAFPANVRWAGGTPPTMTATAGRSDLFTFFYDAGLDRYLGAFSQNYTEA